MASSKTQKRKHEDDSSDDEKNPTNKFWPHFLLIQSSLSCHSKRYQRFSRHPKAGKASKIRRYFGRSREGIPLQKPNENDSACQHTCESFPS